LAFSGDAGVRRLFNYPFADCIKNQAMMMPESENRWFQNNKIIVYKYNKLLNNLTMSPMVQLEFSCWM
jgi:hypothetical protein